MSSLSVVMKGSLGITYNVSRYYYILLVVNLWGCESILVYAFMAETFPISRERSLIVQKLRHQWNISEDTYNYVAIKIKKYLENPQDCPEEEERPLIISEEKAALSPTTCVPNSGLYLNLGLKCQAVDIRTWIDAAVSHHLHSLRVISTFEIEPIRLSGSLYTCGSLETLKLVRA